MSYNLSDYNLDPPDDDDRSDYIVGLLQEEFDKEFIEGIMYQSVSDEFNKLMLKLSNGTATDKDKSDIETELSILYAGCLEIYIDENYDARVCDLNDPY